MHQKHFFTGVIMTLLVISLFSCRPSRDTTNYDEVIKNKVASRQNAFYPIDLSGKTVYMNNQGKVVLEPPIQWGDFFQEGLAAFRLQKKGNFGFIDTSGAVVVEPKFHRATSFAEGLVCVHTGISWGYADQKGNIVIKPQFAAANSFAEGLAPVKQMDKWGYIDKSGQYIIKPQFEDASGFSNGLAMVRKSSKYGYIDKEGDFVIKPKYSWAHDFSEGMAPVTEKYNDKYGYINKSGEYVIQPKFDSAMPFSEGLAPVLYSLSGQERYWGYIDRTGKSVILPEFESGEAFWGGLARVKIDDEYEYIDTKGKLVALDVPSEDVTGSWKISFSVFIKDSYHNYEEEYRLAKNGNISHEKGEIQGVTGYFKVRGMEIKITDKKPEFTFFGKYVLKGTIVSPTRMEGKAFVYILGRKEDGPMASPPLTGSWTAERK